MARIKWGSDVGDILVAIDDAMFDIEEALEDMKGIGELVDVCGALEDSKRELEQLKEKYESYMTGEYQAVRAEQLREWQRERMWGR